MRKILKLGVFALLGMALAFSASSCSDDDPDYSNVTPPTVAQVHNISGSIAGRDGKGISGATVTIGGAMSATATTDANGFFIFEDVKIGTYNLKAAAEGKIPQEASVSVTDEGDGQNVVWNVMLASEETVTNITVSNEEGGEGNVTTEALEGNEKAEIPVEVVVPPAALSEEAMIEISPVYSEEEAAQTRGMLSTMAIATRASGDSRMLVGSRLSCSKSDVTITKPIELTFNVDETTATEVRAQKYSNGAWVDVPSRIENGKVIVEADEFTSYGLFLGISISSTSRNEAISFSQNVWDNLYGNGNMNVGTATYTYMVGMDVNTSGTTVFTALLIEALARAFGANSYQTQGNYPINVTLPIGTKLEIRGIQKINTVTASAAGRSVSGTQYGDVTITVVTSNRSHTGGGN